MGVRKAGFDCINFFKTQNFCYCCRKYMFQVKFIFRVILIYLGLILHFYGSLALGDKRNWESTYPPPPPPIQNSTLKSNFTLNINATDAKCVRHTLLKKALFRTQCERIFRNTRNYTLPPYHPLHVLSNNLGPVEQHIDRQTIFLPR